MNLIQYLSSIIDENDTVLDVGSGNREHQPMSCKSIVGIDAWEHVNPSILLDLEKKSIPFLNDTFDFVLMIDFIEHVTKEAGERLIKEAIAIARKNVILMTPLWWTTNADNTENPELWCYGNKYNYHKSLWKLEDFKDWSRVLKIQDLDDYFLGMWGK